MNENTSIIQTARNWQYLLFFRHYWTALDDVLWCQKTIIWKNTEIM
jgi:hypothetical protein